MPGKTAKKPIKKAASKPVRKTAAKAKPASKPTAKSVKKVAAKAVKKTVTKATKAAPKAATKPVVSKPVAKKAAAPMKSKVQTAQAPTNRGPRSDQLEFKAYTPYQEKRGEEYMGPAQVTHFRNILESWKRELMEKVDETVHHMQDEAANFPDPNDRASQESDFTMELRARDRERKLIKKIEEAMQRLDDNDFGYCESCGVEIGIRRLEARPTATLCIDCKELDEIRERQSKG